MLKLNKTGFYFVSDMPGASVMYLTDWGLKKCHTGVDGKCP